MSNFLQKLFSYWKPIYVDVRNAQCHNQTIYVIPITRNYPLTEIVQFIKEDIDVLFISNEMLERRNLDLDYRVYMLICFDHVQQYSPLTN